MLLNATLVILLEGLNSNEDISTVKIILFNLNIDLLVGGFPLPESYSVARNIWEQGY